MLALGFDVGNHFVILAAASYKILNREGVHPMAMRYLVRRTNAEDFQEIKKDVPNLEQQLGKIGADFGTAGAHYRRDIEVRIANDRYINYQFAGLKRGTELVWTCPSIELVADEEQGLFALCDRVKTPRPSHLTNS